MDKAMSGRPGRGHAVVGLHSGRKHVQMQAPRHAGELGPPEDPIEDVRGCSAATPTTRGQQRQAGSAVSAAWRPVVAAEPPHEQRSTSPGPSCRWPPGHGYRDNLAGFVDDPAAPTFQRDGDQRDHQRDHVRRVVRVRPTPAPPGPRVTEGDGDPGPCAGLVRDRAPQRRPRRDRWHAREWDRCQQIPQQIICRR